MTEQRWFHRRGDLAEGGWETVVDERTAGWEHTGVRVARLSEGQSIELSGTGVERLIVPLAGSFSVAHAAAGDASAATTTLAGRASVFAGPTDVLYLSSDSTGTVTATSPGESRFLVATSPTGIVRPTHYMPVDEVPVELRGAGASSRQVHNFGRKESLDAARFIVVEVITPAENWSSYPPHKHDVHTPGHESELEEIYYFEVAPTREAPAEVGEEHAFGMFSTYSSPAGDIDIDARVFTGDVALVPFGYHGPAVAAPGYDMYYLNVMAGPDPERTWLISDDPAHGWVRDTWEGQELDSRLPFTADPATEGAA
ncbi:5-deoxy-glucuronate isomerase [Leucobacter rhizosphaerae]|uniref:5-deoxy-glucuronate isomerase n=1 Tax=Leucobacter rhizosphaerae TaxID=2932245 RepID=A0ABY4FSQ1_9MICO|nr:5-deoxy-glucuronate isomerase [Leucobacter rhizosphaerae]UOQ59296.1 5-deoxy-glucuronate isomerase [Leucobacter rhizosphaerae]